jgi:hypothetical protein
MQAARLLDTWDSRSHLFSMPVLVSQHGKCLAEALAWAKTIAETYSALLASHQQACDDIANHLYGLDSDKSFPSEDDTDKAEASEEKANIGTEVDCEEGLQFDSNEDTYVVELISYCVGVAFGRFDVRFATGEKQVPELPDPFASLPVSSPGMLQGIDGMPLAETPERYPIRINWDGIFADDTDHCDDIVRHVRGVLEVIWADQEEAVERGTCDILAAKTLRDYFRKPGKGGFWDAHVSRYSKSRRKAPIYWLLQSSKKNYALWLYYQRLDKDFLFKALVNYVEPKIRLEENRLETLRTQKSAAGGSGRDAKRLGKEVERQEEFLSELRDFEDKLRRVANLHLEPDLNDGVVLNIAPLWELVPWKEAKNYWEELLEGKYEWSSIGKQLREKELVK